MPHPKSTTRYPEVQEMMNRAMDSDRGIRIQVPDRKAAFSLRMKVLAKKKDWRETYIRMYENDPGNPDRERDPFQPLFPEIKEDETTGKWYLYLHKEDPFSDQFFLDVEDL